MDVNFYHLTHSPLEKTLPRLLEKVLAAKLRAVVLTDTDERLQAFDSLLWTYSSLGFLPHGSIREGEAAYQPIWLTTQLENPNGAKVIVVTDGTLVTKDSTFEKCIDLFNGMDEEMVKATRQRWKTYKEKGHCVTYWQQDEKGKWIKN